MRAKVDEIIEEMREQEVIEESESPWMSPAVLMKKKDGTIILCRLSQTKLYVLIE